MAFAERIRSHGSHASSRDDGSPRRRRLGPDVSAAALESAALDTPSLLAATLGSASVATSSLATDLAPDDLAPAALLLAPPSKNGRFKHGPQTDGAAQNGASTNGASTNGASTNGPTTDGAAKNGSPHAAASVVRRRSGGKAGTLIDTVAAPDGIHCARGGVGDHYAVHRLLVGVFHGPSAAEFQAQLDEPLYEPSNRFLVKHGPNLVSHLRIVPRAMRFGSAVLPACGVADLATQPEYRRHGFASSLVAQAEQQMRADGALLGFVRTTAPRLFRRRGWFVCGRHCSSTVGTRELLAQLCLQQSEQKAPSQASQFAPNESRAAPIVTRIWRHVEQSALLRLYDANTRAAFGPLVRGEDYWHWLVSRHGFEQIYVVIEGRDRLDLDDAHIIGYAVVKQGRIVELMTASGRPQAAAQLLLRIGGDLIEQDIDSLRFDGPPNDPLHATFVSAGGRFHHGEQEKGQWQMAKVLDLPGLLLQIGPQLFQRASEAGLAAPIELGVRCGAEKGQLVVTRRDARLIEGKLGRHSIACGVGDFSQMLLGHCDIDASVAEQRVEFSTRTAAELARTLFPSLGFWRPPFDELPA